MNHDLTDRDLRQRDLVPPEKLAAIRATVIGVGAIGRQVAVQLASIGVPWLQLIDPDTVEPVNLACQGYFCSDVGRPKVHATGEMCHEINPQLELYEQAERFRRSTDLGEPGRAVFCCVDSIATRRRIWDAVRDQVLFFADGRMSAEVLRVLVAADARSREHYPSTLFGSEEAYAGACTARSSIFTANIAAGLMLEQFSRWLRCVPVDRDLQINLLASELTLHA